MLIHLATFPRCGHALTRNLIVRNFGLLTANAYPATRPEKPSQQLRPAPSAEPGFPPGLAWGEFMRVYRNPLSGQAERLVDDGAQRFLTPELRRALGAEPYVHIVKTHGLPPEAPVPGEAAIQMVRHPAAALSSWAKLWPALHGGQALPLRKLIRAAGEKSWTDYHQAWSLGGLPLLRIRYEDAFDDPAPAVAQLAAFLGRPAPAQTQGAPLEEATRGNPERNPGRGVGGWRKDLTDEEIAEIWARHGAAAERLGYGLETTVVGPLERDGSAPQGPSVQALASALA